MSPSVAVCLFALTSALASPSAQPPTYNLQARHLIDQQQLHSALKLLNQAVQQKPVSAETLYLRGYVLYRLHELDNAKLQLEQVTRLTDPALHASYFLGRIAMLQGHPEDAIRWLTKPAEQTPPIEDAPAQLSKAYLDAHQLQPSKLWTEKALQLTPWDGSLHYRLARINQQLGDPASAEREFRSSIQLRVSDHDAITKLVESSKFIAGGDFRSARQIRDSFLQEHQLDPDVLVALGSSFATAGLPQDALSLFQAGAARDASSFQAHFDWGLALLNLQKPSDAIAPLEISRRIAPSSVDCNAALGLAYVLVGKFQDALPMLETVHSTRPENLKTEGLLALTYLRTNAPGKAVPIIKTSIARQAADPKLYFLLIECLNSLEDPNEALAVANQAVTKFPDLAKAHLAKAQQLSRLGKYEEAGPSFEKASGLAPHELEPLLGLAEVQNKSGNYAGSQSTYQQALQLDARNLTAELGAARNLIALGKLSDARDLLTQAATDHNDSLQVHFELSRVYLREGARDLAAHETEMVQKLRSQPQ